MKKLIFKDLVTGEVWDHAHDCWILTYCNFNSPIHPTLLRIGQTTIGKSVEGHEIEIKMVKETSDEIR